jgi:hypothetical protein
VVKVVNQAAAALLLKKQSEKTYWQHAQCDPLEAISGGTQDPRNRLPGYEASRPALLKLTEGSGFPVSNRELSDLLAVEILCKSGATEEVSLVASIGFEENHDSLNVHPGANHLIAL